MSSILGVKINNLKITQAIEKADRLICNKKFSYAVTVNPEFVIQAQIDKEFKNILNRADLSLADGFGIILAFKILGKKVTERITGVDFTWKLAELAQKRGYSIFFLGAKPNIAKKAAFELKGEYPDLKIAGFYSGSPSNHKTIDLLKKTKPDILLVAFGAPKQEKFIYQNKNLLKIPFSVGVGGTFDYISGYIPRAPQIMRTLGLEWLYRLFHEPKRLKRILKATIIFPLLVLKYKYLNKIYLKD